MSTTERTGSAEPAAATEAATEAGAAPAAPEAATTAVGAVTAVGVGGVGEHTVSGGPPRIVELGHTGLWVQDLAVMRDFYTRVLGLTVTDEDLEIGMVFLSSRPDVEHHEMVLAVGRTAPLDTRQTHQISWRVDSMASLLAFKRRFDAEGVRLQQVVTHGNAFGIYFFDPEGNRGEVYWPTGREIPQPFRKTLDLDQDPDAIFAEAAQLLADGGPDYQPVV